MMNQRLPVLAVLCATAAALLCMLALAGAGKAEPAPRASQPAIPGPPWKLVWSDEFDYEGLPDPKKWDYEEGFVRNNEAQYYTRARKENARVEGGMLVIEGRREKYAAPARPNARGGGSGREVNYTSASLITRNKADWKFGRVEARAKLPQGLGVWPAFWMLGSTPHVGWPAGGEIDIMEFVGHTPGLVHATVHFQKDGKHKSSGSKLAVEKPWDGFHVYAVEWFPDHMDFYFDEKKYHTFPISQADDKGGNPFLKPQYLLINLALGGSWGKQIDDTILPQKYVIDYVRVYQRPEAPADK